MSRRKEIETKSRMWLQQMPQNCGMWLPRTPQKFSLTFQHTEGELSERSGPAPSDRRLVRVGSTSHLRVLAMSCLSSSRTTFRKQERFGEEGLHSSGIPCHFTHKIRNAKKHLQHMLVIALFKCSPSFAQSLHQLHVSFLCGQSPGRWDTQ